MHTSAFYAGGEISPVKELNTTLPGYERDNNVHNGPAGTYVWAGPPPHVSLPGVIPHHYQSTNKPGTVDTPCLRFPCSCQSTQCQVTYPDYHLEPQSSQYHIVTGYQRRKRKEKTKVTPIAKESEDLPSTSASCQDDLKGKFILVKYESKPFVGQVIQVVGEEVEVSCMQQLGEKNVFTWPHPPDILFYYESDVLH